MIKLIISLFVIASIHLQADSKNKIAVLVTTAGIIELELYENIAPKAVENFTTHIKNGYYDGVAFHRIIKNFMIQG